MDLDPRELEHWIELLYQSQMPRYRSVQSTTLPKFFNVVSSARSHLDTIQLETIYKFINQSEEFLKGHEQIDETTVLVLFNNMNSCSLDILVMAFINSDQWMDLQLVKQDIFFAFMKIAEDLGVGFAFPTTTIEFENQSPSAQ